MSVKRLIVGWNRGGLGYVHELLTRAGFDAGLTFGPGTTLKEFEDKFPSAHRFEVSPYVVPYLWHPLLRDTHVFFLLRDPMRVLNSLYFHGLFHNEKDSAVQRAAFTHLPGFEDKFRGRPAQAACSYLELWLRMAHDQQKNVINLRVEEGPVALLRKIAGSTTQPPFLSPSVNSSWCKQKLVPSSLPANSKLLMTRLITRLGYREWAWLPRGGHAHYVNPDWHC